MMKLSTNHTLHKILLLHGIPPNWRLGVECFLHQQSADPYSPLDENWSSLFLNSTLNVVSEP